MQMWFMTNFPMHHFPKKFESVQYNVALTITWTIKGSSREQLYQDGWEGCACSIKFFQLFSHPIFMIHYHQWGVLVDMLIRLIRFLVNLNISRTLSFLISLKAQRQISKKRCFEKYCSCDKACHFSALWGTPSQSYLENPTVDCKFINKRVRLFINQIIVKRKG